MKKFFLIVSIVLSLISHIEAAPTRILSLDGGGVRGVVTLEFLLQLEKQAKLNCQKDFEIYAGSSTGSIIASFLALGVDVERILEAYKTFATNVFGNASYFSFFQPKYDHQQLRVELEAFFDACEVSKDVRFKQIPKKIMITTVNLDDQEQGRWRFELIENMTGKFHEKELIEAIMESTAAPTYFSSESDHVDGGVAMNDPSLAALSYSLDPEIQNLNQFVILGIGTGYTKRFVQPNESWGLFQWAFSGSKTSGKDPIVNLLIDVQEQLPSQLCQKLLGNRYLKINFALPEETPLDDAEAIGPLIAQTDAYIQQNPKIWNQNLTWVRRNLRR